MVQPAAYTGASTGISMVTLIALLLALVPAYAIDADGDGVDSELDCNDADATVFPGAPEPCEPQGTPQVDNDCDGSVNTENGKYHIDTSDPLNFTVLPPTPAQIAQLPVGGFVWNPNYVPPANAEGAFYPDDDNDGEGSMYIQRHWLCSTAAESRSWERTRIDCDDTDELVNALAVEICDGVDNNCNERIDEPTADTHLDPLCEPHFLDGDGDGWGGEETQCICPAYQTLVTQHGSVTQIPHPQVCTSWLDGQAVDGHLLAGNCYVRASGDCDDLNALIRPIGPGEAPVELLDGVDSDCDGQVALMELDCDGDRAVPLPPVLNPALAANPAGNPIYAASEVGLAACDALPDPVVRCASTDDEVLPVTCDLTTGLWVVSVEWLRGRARGALGIWDCDDTCPERLAEGTEVCDGMDTTCQGAVDAALGDDPLGLVVADTDGVPDAMLGGSAGLLAEEEWDADGDGILFCDADATPAGELVLSFGGCETLERRDPVADPVDEEPLEEKPDTEECGCSNSPSPGLLFLAPLWMVRRRRAASRPEHRGRSQQR